MKRLAASLAIMATLQAMPAHAFFDEIVLGMTSVTNNLIDSSESVANNGITTTSNTILLLSRDIGKMADRIGLMADRIGVMADRIVLTESMLANFAHKLVDTGAAASARMEAAPIPAAATYATAPLAAAPLACAEPPEPGKTMAC